MSSKVKILTAEEILLLNDSERFLVEVPEWRGSVYIKVMTSAEKESFESWVQKKLVVSGPDRKDLAKVDSRLVRVSLLQRVLVGEDGALLFSVDQLEALNQKNSRVIDRLTELAQKHNGMTKEAAEDVRKN